jgi:PIN domain nuclease of toxin-antitoxin system
LSAPVQRVLEDSSAFLYISIVSVWEIAIKISIGKLRHPGGSTKFLSILQNHGIEMLGVNGSYIVCVENLPFPDNHRDPFDRLLIATAMTEGLTILTADENIHGYDVPCLW